MKARRGLGLVELATQGGATFYIAEEDDDTSGLFEVGSDSYGNAIYSNTPGATPSPDVVNSIGDVLGSIASIYHQYTTSDIKAQQVKATVLPKTSTLTTQQMLLYGAIAAVVFMMLNKR